MGSDQRWNIGRLLLSSSSVPARKIWLMITHALYASRYGKALSGPRTIAKRGGYS